MSFSILLVDYCSIKETLKYIDICNLKMKSSGDIQFFITDNSLTGEAWKHLEDNYSRTNIIKIDKYDVYEYLYNDSKIYCIPTYDNMGYARGNNVAGNASIKLFPENHLLVSNNDILFEEECDLDVVDGLFNDNNYAIIGPDVIQHGQHLNPINIYNKSYYMFLIYLNTVLPKKIAPRSKTDKRTFSGCFWFINNQFYKQLRGFDEGTFMYYEEQIMAERVNQLGGEFYYHSDMHIIHNHSTKVLNTKRAIRYMNTIHKSGNYYVKKYLKPNAIVYACSNICYYLLMVIFILERLIRDFIYINKKA